MQTLLIYKIEIAKFMINFKIYWIYISQKMMIIIDVNINHQ